MDADIDYTTIEATDDWPVWEIKFKVEDTGCGIDPQYTHMLFKKFSQLPQAPDPLRRGSGLGLSICQQIAQRMNGTVVAESEGVGKGSRFTLTLQLPGRADIGVPRDIAQAMSVNELIKQQTAAYHSETISHRTREQTPTLSLQFGPDDDLNTLAERITAPELLSTAVIVYHTSKIVAELLRRRLEAWGVLARVTNDQSTMMHLVAVSAFKATMQPYIPRLSEHALPSVSDLLVKIINEVNSSARRHEQVELSADRCKDVMHLVHRPFDTVLMVQVVGNDGALHAAASIKQIYKLVSEATRRVLQSKGLLKDSSDKIVGVGVLISAPLAYRQQHALDSGQVQHYLSQPVRPQQLFDALQLICERRRTGSDLRQHRRLASEQATPMQTNTPRLSVPDLRARMYRTPSIGSRSLTTGGASLPSAALPNILDTEEDDTSEPVTLAALSPSALRSTSNPERGRGDQEPDWKLLRILVVEDNPINSKVLGRLLTKTRYANVSYAVDGLQAINAVTGVTLLPDQLDDAEANPAHYCCNTQAANIFDLVLMDWQMPLCDGLQASRIIRRFGEANPMLGVSNTQPHIITVTANAMIGDREKCLQSGTNAYLAKPVRQFELTKLIDAVNFSTTTTSKPANNASSPRVAGKDDTSVMR